jgi:hypothetical protein
LDILANFSDLTFQQYVNIVKADIIQPRIKIEILNIDETVNYEIINDIIDGSGTLNINFQNTGIRRTCNLNLNNINGQYIPSPNTSGFWVTDKYKLYLGFHYNGVDYWKSNGVFVHTDPSAIGNDSDKQIKINGVDKFGLLDGTVSGKLTETYYIPIGSNIHSAIRAFLSQDRGDGYPIDNVPPILDNDSAATVTSYDIYIDQNGTGKDVLDKLADQVSSYLYYNEDGALVLESGTRDLGDSDKGSLWDYGELEKELLTQNVDYMFTNVVNKYIIVGDNINGNIIRGIAENSNPFSGTRIGRIPTISETEYVDTIDTQQKVDDLADLRLKERSMLNVGYSLSSTFMIHLDVNKVITASSDYYNFEDERFLMQTISIPLSTGSVISIGCSNVNQLPFYEGVE